MKREELSLVAWQAKRRVFICSSSAGKRWNVESGVEHSGVKRKYKEERERTDVISFDGNLGG